MTGRKATAGDPCPTCQPGHLWLAPDGHLQCSNCPWNSEEVAGRAAAAHDVQPLVAHDLSFGWECDTCNERMAGYQTSLAAQVAADHHAIVDLPGAG